MKLARFVVLSLVVASSALAQKTPGAPVKPYPRALVSFDDVKELVSEVEGWREGYGYRNVYELAELVRIDDPRITFEGSVVEKAR